ncbi:type IV secretory system conjugative DNA transfer family protein [Candidatus Gracilibacteria bacterium]|nr:type IV secretory system conjugative DNA transfer family protein [Candidatus Gracilibacteria bacterium]
MKTFLVKVPQDNQKTAGAFEEVLRHLHETLRGEHVSFELVAMGQNIGFCFTADSATAQVVSGQIYASSPDADIVEIPDFTKNVLESTNFLSAELGLVRHDLFPIKTYKEFDGDSLSGVLSVMSKIMPGEGVWIQLVVCPTEDTGFHHFKLGWRKRFEKIRHIFRVKYWFKRGAAKSFGEKIEDKISGRLFQVSLRIACLSDNPQKSPENRMKAVLGAISNFNTLDLNQIRIGKVQHGSGRAKDFRERKLRNGFYVSTPELAGLFHLPNEKEVPNIIHVLARRAEPPSNLPTDPRDKEISFFGATNFHGQTIPFGIRRSDRRRHLYTVGKSGSGKSKLLELLIQNDILAGKGVGVLDPHGDLIDNVLKMIPLERIKDVVVFDPADLNFPVAFNPIEDVPPELKIRVTIGFIEIFKKLFGANWTPRLEHVLRYTTLALLDTPGTTILSILKMLSDKNYRQTIVRNIQDNVVKNFWVNEFAGWSEKFDNEAITPLLNKVGQFVSTNMIRNIVGQPKNLIDFRDIMDNQKIFLMKVSKGILGEENAALLGAIVVTKIYQSAMSRADIPEEDRIDFYLYVDEFHNFATDTFDEILSEARKYRLNLTMAHQFLGQLSTKIRTTVFGNVGAMVSFRVGGEDAHILAEEFNPRFSERDIINLGVRDFYLKMSIEGELCEAFSGRTLDMNIPRDHHAREIVEYTHTHYARPLQEVLNILQQWEEGKFDPKVDPNKKGNSSLEEEVDFQEPIV